MRGQTKLWIFSLDLFIFFSRILGLGFWALSLSLSLVSIVLYEIYGGDFFPKDMPKEVIDGNLFFLVFFWYFLVYSLAVDLYLYCHQYLFGGFFLPVSLARLFDPHSDLDASASTDADDLVVFIADIFEFSEHEQALVLDSLTEIFMGGALVFALGGFSTLSIRSTKN
jgi:hypothetical protein